MGPTAAARNPAAPIILLGAGGHARVLLGLLRRAGFTVCGFVAPAPNYSAGPPLLGDDDWLAAQPPALARLVNGIGSVSTPRARRALFERFDAAGFAFPPLVDPDARIDDDTPIGDGAQILRGALLQPGVSIGRNVIVNTGAIVDHDCRIGDHAHIAPGCVLSGGVTVGPGAHIGVGSVVKDGVRIGANCLIGAGSLVIRDIPDGRRAWGAPAVLRDDPGAEGP